ncbi:MAG: hypothetical protein ACTHON_18175 [Humibacter sp.]
MSDLLSWPALVFFVYVAGYVGIAALMPKHLQEEGIELPPAGVALLAILLAAWPAALAWSIVEFIKNRVR